ncbi:collectin-12-like [Mytilus trossulus]|uniref:collectin-12-like n=1 Tax=Mytilus trossulus TaxID=6551 RepID=UPI003005517B
MGDQVELVNILDTEDFQGGVNIKTNVWNQKLAKIHKAFGNRDKFILVFIVVQVICISLTIVYLNTNIEKIARLETQIQQLTVNSSKLTSRDRLVQLSSNRGLVASTKDETVYRDEAGSYLKTGSSGKTCNHKGEKGERGYNGLRGLSGDKGEIGHKGPLGEKGPTGKKGQKGEKGLKGETGPIGNKGQIGDKGQDGDKGVDGTNGIDGNKGEQGAKGREGDKGEQGSTGIVGLTGNKGLPGEKGLAGSKGHRGETGLPGLKGIHGEKGINGDKGAIGNKGRSGGKQVQEKSCGDGWEQFKQSCYFIEISPTKTWNEAKMDCHIKGSRLVKVDNAFENSFLKSFAKVRNAHHVWIGAHIPLRQSHFVWEADNTNVTFTDWAPRQPDNYRNAEDCVHMDYGLSNTWNDNSCSKKVGYICEKQNKCRSHCIFINSDFFSQKMDEHVYDLPMEDQTRVYSVLTKLLNDKHGEICKSIRKRDKLMIVLIVMQLICLSVTAAFIVMHFNGKTFSCPNGWEHFIGSCYYFQFSSEKTWSAAKDDCHRKGGFLVKIDSAVENWFLKTFIKTYSPSAVWIGAHDTNEESHFVWESDISGLTYTDWYPDEPNDQHGEDCVQMSKSYDYAWNDEQCSYAISYICERQ